MHGADRAKQEVRKLSGKEHSIIIQNKTLIWNPQHNKVRNNIKKRKQLKWTKKTNDLTTWSTQPQWKHKHQEKRRKTLLCWEN